MGRGPLGHLPTEWEDTPEHTITIEGTDVRCTCEWHVTASPHHDAARIVAADHARRPEGHLDPSRRL